jgi:hypothetical protein
MANGARVSRGRRSDRRDRLVACSAHGAAQESNPEGRQYSFPVFARRGLEDRNCRNSGHAGKNWAKVWGGDSAQATKKGPVSGAFAVAGAGFEPATSGL